MTGMRKGKDKGIQGEGIRLKVERKGAKCAVMPAEAGIQYR
jgi:hypothetical protein